jgi:hypothetical protein
MLFVGIGVAIAASLIVVFVLNGSGGSGGADKAKPAANAPANPAPKAAPAAASTPVALAGAKAGKVAKKPAPALTQDTLTKVRDLLEEAKKLSNEGVTARNGGDNMAARDKQSAAKDKLDELQKLVQAPLTWQEEAQMEDWAQPAEYVTLENLYAEVGKLLKRVRMGGGS